MEVLFLSPVLLLLPTPSSESSDPTRKCKTESQDDCVYASSSRRVGGSRLGFSFSTVGSLITPLVLPTTFILEAVLVAAAARWICSRVMIGHGDDDDVDRYSFMESRNSGVSCASFPISFFSRLVVPVFPSSMSSSSSSSSSIVSSPPNSRRRRRPANPRLGSSIPILSKRVNASNASR